VTVDAGDIRTLDYLTPAGDRTRARGTVTGRADQVPPPLSSHLIRLDDGTEAVQVSLAEIPAKRLAEAYGKIDNQILAGLRLARHVGAGRYPPQVSKLIGYDPDSAQPFALYEPYRGEQVESVAGHLLPAGQHKFQASLLTGLRWLAEAGIAHRGLSPVTVRWDGEQAQITDFSLATLLGSRREVAGTKPWAAPEQQPGYVSGDVTDRDDIWAAGRLIFYVVTGEDLVDRDHLGEWPALADLLAGVFEPPERRPSAREMLAVRLRERDPVPAGPHADPELDKGRAEFFASRARLRHEPTPADAEIAEPPAAWPPQPPPVTASPRRGWRRVMRTP
jgi:serine/threonine protein kinase